MKNDSSGIRELMNLLESIQQTTLVEGWVDSLNNKINRRLGDRERAKMASELTGEYYQWLGKTNRPGTAEDVVRFMTHRIGFNSTDIDEVLNKVSPTIARDADQANDEQDEDDTSDQPPAKRGYDPEEGVPIPKDLNVKLSDFKDVGIDVEASDNKVEPQEIVDNPRKYQSGNDWDRKKIRAKLDKMPLGAKLTLGTSTFTRTSGKNSTQFFTDPAATKESISEAANGVLSKKEIAAIMKASAERVNDEYLMNGPANDAAAQPATRGRNVGRQSAASTEPSVNEPGKAASGQYNAKELSNILKTDFQIHNPDAWVTSLSRKVMAAKSISELSDNDMHDVGLMGWALIRARN